MKKAAKKLILKVGVKATVGCLLYLGGKALSEEIQKNRLLKQKVEKLERINQLQEQLIRAYNVKEAMRKDKEAEG